MNTTLMTQLKATNVLGESDLFTQIQDLRNKLQYKSNEKLISFDEYFVQLQAEADSVPRVKLQNEVPTGAGMIYMSELLTHLEDIHDQSASLILKIVRFIGELSRANADIKDMAAIFKAWYIVGASEIISQSDTKLPANIVKSLADSEFSQLMGGVNNNIESLLTALDILHETVKNKKKLAQTKFELGKEQANVSFYRQLPETLGISASAPKFDFIAKPEVSEPDYDDFELTDNLSEVHQIKSPIQEPAQQLTSCNSVTTLVIPEVCDLLNNLESNEPTKKLETIVESIKSSAKRLTFDDMETPVTSETLPIVVPSVTLELPKPPIPDNLSEVHQIKSPIQEPAQQLNSGNVTRRRTFTINMEGLE